MGVTPLPACCRACVVAGVLIVGSAPTSSQAPQDPPLHAAVRRGNIAELRRLIDSGADVHATGMIGQTALHVAGRQGDPEIARLLLDAGADPAARDNLGAVPLHEAASAGSADTVRMLLAHGARVDTRTRYRKETPLRRAVASTAAGSTDVVRMLLEARARTDLKDEGPAVQTELDLALNQRNYEKASLLMGAASKARTVVDERRPTVRLSIYQGDPRSPKGDLTEAVSWLLSAKGYRVSAVGYRGAFASCLHAREKASVCLTGLGDLRRTESPSPPVLLVDTQERRRQYPVFWRTPSGRWQNTGRTETVVVESAALVALVEPRGKLRRFRWTATRASSREGLQISPPGTITATYFNYSESADELRLRAITRVLLHDVPTADRFVR